MTQLYNLLQSNFIHIFTGFFCVFLVLSWVLYYSDSQNDVIKEGATNLDDTNTDFLQECTSNEVKSQTKQIDDLENQLNDVKCSDPTIPECKNLYSQIDTNTTNIKSLQGQMQQMQTNCNSSS